MTEAQELQVRAQLQAMVETAMVTGRVNGSPIYYENLQEYWRTLDNSDTLDEVELSHVKLGVIRYSQFVDDPNSSDHSPLTTHTYNLYLFSQYDVVREDESMTPDPIKQRQLKVYNDFIATIMRLKSAFQGTMTIPGLGTDFAVKETAPLEVTEQVQERVECLYIPQVIGFSIGLNILARIELREC